MTEVFCVRAEYGQYASAFIKGGYIAIGWVPKIDFSNLKLGDYEKLRETYVHEHPTVSPLSLGQNVGQIARFLFEVKPEDIVVTPTYEVEKLAVGKVTSNYYYETDAACPFPHRKRVTWCDNPVLRSSLSVPLQNTLRSSLAVYRISRADEMARAAGFQIATTPAAHVEADLYSKVLERILELSFDEFEILVTGLLASMGFEAEHVGRPGDEGIDVQGILNVYGFANVELKVQVKRYSSGTRIGPKEIGNFRGRVPEKSQAAFVATCKFNKKAYEEALKPGFKRIGLIDGRQLVDLMVAHYDNLSEELREKLRLRKTLVPEE